MSFDETGLIPEIIASIVLEEREQMLSVDDRCWFIDFTSHWLRWYYDRSEDWRKRLNGENGRDEAYKWISHWADSMIKNPQKFREEHPDTLIGLHEQNISLN